VTSTPLGALAAFHPLVRRWFTERFDAPTDAQARAWPAIARGEHVLVSAPTGSGKTLTAFLAVLDNLITGRWGGGAVRALYLSPLKALNTDVRQNLLVPLAELRDLFEREGVPFPSLRVLTRSGDTPDDERRAMLRRPPEILITTPESLNLMLTGTQSRRLFADLRIVILDEIHALAASKRGTYMMSAVERLAWAAGEIQRVALSATVHPVERIAAWMAGFEVRDPGPEVSYRARPVTVIASADRRELALRLCTPDVESSRGPDAADLWWQALAAELKAVIGRNRATLLFANSRRSVEKLVRLLNAGEPEPIAYSHHGSLSRELRLDVEARMKQGRLRAVVATGSLELGIDIGSVDEVVLIGTPPSVAQTLQRIGRADHRVGGTSKARLFSLHGLDHAQAAAMAEMVGRNALEALRPIANPLDVLAQLLLSLGCGVRWDLDQLFAQVRGIAAYRTLPRRHFDLVVAMLAGRYADVPVRDLKARALVDRVANTFTTRPGTEVLLYQSGGTIPDRGYYHLRLADSKAVIGELDEEFVWERRLGDQFTLGTQAWRILAITHNDVEVGPADGRGPMIPFWKAEEQNRSTAASFALLDFFDHCEASLGQPGFAADLARRHAMEPVAAQSLARFLALQREVAGAPLPGRRRILVEHNREAAASGESQQVIFHTFWGGRVNRPFAIALAQAFQEAHATPLEVFASNDQILCALPEGFEPAALFALAPSHRLGALLRAGLERTPLFGARFRENAGRALLLPRGDARKRLPLWLNRLRAKKLLGAVARFEDFPMVLETWRELLEDELELGTLAGLLDEVARGEIAMHVVRPARPTPFAEGVVFRQTNYHMYLDDAPGPGAGSRISDELVRDLLHGASAPPPIPRELAELYAGKLLRTLPDYRPSSRQDVLLAVRELLVPPLAAVEDWLAHLPPDEQTPPERDPLTGLVVYALPGARDELVSDLADLARIVALRGEALVSLRPFVGEGAEAVAAYLRGARRRTKNESAATLVADLLHARAIVTAAELTAVLGWSADELVPLLDELVETGGVVAGALLEEGPERCFCDAEHAERLWRLRRAAERGRAARALAPLALGDYPRFLAEWQGLGRAPGGLEVLQRSLDRLFGYPAAAELWETALLPARLEPYFPSWLDTLFQSYGLGWLGCGRERVTLAFPADRELFAETSPRDDDDPVGAAVLAHLRAAEPGMGFFELATATGIDTGRLAEALWRLAWAGRVSSDSFETVRRGQLAGFVAETAAEPGGRAGFRRWERSRPSAGRWRCLPPTEPGSPVAGAELEKERARIVLDRYGIVFRELLERELAPLRWRRLFRALRLLELSGEIVGGHFVSGVPGLQFATPEAIRRLAEPPPPERTYFVNAADPASLCGLALPGLPEGLPRRLPGNWLVYRGGERVIALHQGGRALDVACSPGAAALAPALAIYRLLLGREHAPLASVTVESINGAAAGGSPYADDLRRAGFTSDYRGLTLWRPVGHPE